MDIWTVIGAVLIGSAAYGLFVTWGWTRDEPKPFPRVRDEPDPSDSAGA